jgi:hypothetical protein
MLYNSINGVLLGISKNVNKFLGIPNYLCYG